ncbi:DUF4390 domain-containing protein [Thiomonas sp. FB-6]|uniref:DUF4390 domain-containing protein n=1 Tax=Thiomonas sp. FB-6 TaxID=1158291 RepID=UPI00056F82B4|nr:DUF4390 domain-containing protein [Thiomonas sp. FB-6]
MSPSQAPDPMRRRVLACAGAGAAATLLAAFPQARAATVDAQPPSVELDPDGVYASATLVFALPVTLEDALHRGIPLYFLTRMSVSQSRWWWFNASMGEGQQLTRLGFEPLLGKYRVSTGGLRTSYHTLDDALNQVQHVAHLKVADAKDLKPGQTYQLGGRFELDLSQLPRPFQLNVASQSDWQLQADFPQVSFTWTTAPSTAPPA